MLFFDARAWIATQEEWINTPVGTMVTFAGCFVAFAFILLCCYHFYFRRRIRAQRAKREAKFGEKGESSKTGLSTTLPGLPEEQLSSDGTRKAGVPTAGDNTDNPNFGSTMGPQPPPNQQMQIQMLQQQLQLMQQQQQNGMNQMNSIPQMHGINAMNTMNTMNGMNTMQMYPNQMMTQQSGVCVSGAMAGAAPGPGGEHGEGGGMAGLPAVPMAFGVPTVSSNSTQPYNALQMQQMHHIQQQMAQLQMQMRALAASGGMALAAPQPTLQNMENIVTPGAEDPDDDDDDVPDGDSPNGGTGAEKQRKLPSKVAGIALRSASASPSVDGLDRTENGDIIGDDYKMESGMDDSDSGHEAMYVSPNDDDNNNENGANNIPQMQMMQMQASNMNEDGEDENENENENKDKNKNWKQWKALQVSEWLEQALLNRCSEDEEKEQVGTFMIEFRKQGINGKTLSKINSNKGASHLQFLKSNFSKEIQDLDWLWMGLTIAVSELQ